MAIARHVGRNTAYQIAAQILPAAALVFAVPFLVHRLGAELYGLLALVVTAVLMFHMLDAGLSRATTRYAARSIAQNSRSDAGAYFWGATGALLLIGMGAAAALFGAAPWIVRHALALPCTFQASAVTSLRLVFGVVPAVTAAATFRGYLEASGRFLHTGLISAIGGACNYAAPAAAVAIGGGIFAAVAAVAAVRILTSAAYLVAALRCEDSPGFRPHTSIRHLRDLASFGGWLCVSNFIGTAMAYGDRYLLGAWMGLAAVTAYAVPLDCVLKLQVLVVSLCTVLFPLLTRMDTLGSQGFRSAYRGATAITMAGMAPLAIGLAVLAPPLMRAWLGQRCTPDSIFAAQVFLAGTPVQAMTAVSWSGLHARGRSDLTAMAHLTEAPLYFTAFWFGVTRFGVPGAALAWLCRILLDFLFMSILLERAAGHGWHWSREALAALLPMPVLVLSRLPAATGVAAGGGLCAAVWAWNWFGLLDHGDRSRLRLVLAELWAGRALQAPRSTGS